MLEELEKIWKELEKEINEGNIEKTYFFAVCENSKGVGFYLSKLIGMEYVAVSLQYTSYFDDNGAPREFACGEQKELCQIVSKTHVVLKAFIMYAVDYAIFSEASGNFGKIKRCLEFFNYVGELLDSTTAELKEIFGEKELETIIVPWLSSVDFIRKEEEILKEMSVVLLQSHHLRRAIKDYFTNRNLCGRFSNFINTRFTPTLEEYSKIFSPEEKGDGGDDERDEEN